MKSWKRFIPVVLLCGLAAAYGLTGCDDQGDADHPVCRDNDGDGYGNPSSTACAHLGLDCDDTNENVYPNAPELCDGMDNQCPGDSAGHGIVDDDAVCLCSFQGGSFVFTVADVEDNCPGLDAASLFPPGLQVGPVDLPRSQDLPRTIDIPFGPPIGTVPVSLVSGGDDIRIEGTTFEFSIPDIGNVTVTLTGGFCPTLPPGQALEVQAAFAVEIPPPTACNVLMKADGNPAAG